MSKIKKALIISSLPVFMLVLSGCGSQTSEKSGFNTPNPALQENNLPQDALANSNEQVVQSAPAVSLEPLPADTNTAVDSEITSIDKELQTTDNAINSADLSDASLGL